jgi:hypothetical protein
VRLDERGGAHILDQKGCRGRMSEKCEANKERRCRDTPSASADASHASEGFLQNRAYRSHSSAGAGGNRETVKCTQSQSRVGAGWEHFGQSGGGRGRMESQGMGMTRVKRRARYAYRTSMVREPT